MGAAVGIDHLFFFPPIPRKIGKMFRKISLVCVAVLVAQIYAQHKGTLTEERTLDLPYSTCTSSGCTEQKGGVTMDGNWRWTHKVGEPTNCYTGNEWDQELCADAASCTENCALDGIDDATWEGTYGVTIDGGDMTLKFVTQGPYSRNVGSRTYLLDESGQKYVKFMLLNQEFSFDVDVSNLPCGLNGALYLVEMDADGGMSFSTNECGAQYGTGYCDAQCPHDMKWINGEANCEEWNPSDNDVNAGTGHYGTCCAEMDLWEANSMAQSFTTHPCEIEGQYRCEGTECGDNASDERYDGVCDKDVAIGLHSVSEMKNSMDLEKLLIPTQESPLSQNGSKTEKLSKTLTSCGMESKSNLTMKSMTISARPPRKSMVTKTITMKLEDSRRWETK